MGIEGGKTEDNSWVSVLCDSAIERTMVFCWEIKGRGYQSNQLMG